MASVGGDVRDAIGFPRNEAPYHILGARELRFDVRQSVETIKRATRNRLEEQDVARAGMRQRRDHEQLADAGNQCGCDAAWPLVRRHPVNIDQRKRTHRLVERRAGRIAGEQFGDIGFAGRHHDKVALAGVALEVGDADIAQFDGAALGGEHPQELRKLDALVDRLRRAGQPTLEADRLGT